MKGFYVMRVVTYGWKKKYETVTHNDLLVDAEADKCKYDRIHKNYDNVSHIIVNHLEHERILARM